MTTKQEDLTFLLKHFTSVFVKASFAEFANDTTQLGGE